MIFLLKPLIFVACIWFFLACARPKPPANATAGGSLSSGASWSPAIATTLIVLFNICFAFRTPFFLPALLLGGALIAVTVRQTRARRKAERAGDQTAASRHARNGGLCTFTLLALYLVVVLALR